MDNNMKEIKRRLRADIRAEIASLDSDYINRSNAEIADILAAMAEFAAARTIFAYYSVGREVDTHEIIRCALESGKTVALPIVFGGGRMEYGILNSDTTMEPGSLNIPEPGPDSIRVIPQKGDIVLVPALYYTKDGYRLGQGGGYYDRLLASCPAYTVGITRELLIRESVPSEIHDIPVQCLVSETGIIRIDR
jgi:5,10-methenyltetrahydrofolate synthetase